MDGGVGSVANQFVSTWDHLIAFTLLAALGLYMVYDGTQAPVEILDKPNKHSFIVLAITAFATSIDAMAVGVSLAFVNVSILVTAAAIGFTTFIMVIIGVMLGRVMGQLVGKRSELAGGIILIGIGSFILYEHLKGLA